MRITIDVTEAEARSATILQEPGDTAAAEPPAKDGGAPSEALLLSLGRASPQGRKDATEAEPGGAGVVDAGPAPASLEEMIRNLKCLPG